MKLNGRYFRTNSQKFIKVLGELQIDLFAARLNFEVEPFCSWKPDPVATYIDSFSIELNEFYSYAFSTICFNSCSFCRKFRWKGQRLMVVPKWLSKPWFSQVTTLIISQIVLISVTHDVLFLPSGLNKVHSMVNWLMLSNYELLNSEIYDL